MLNFKSWELAINLLGKKCVQHVGLVGKKMWMNTFYTQLIWLVIACPQKFLKTCTRRLHFVHITNIALNPLIMPLLSTTSTPPITTTICKYMKEQRRKGL